MAEWFKAPVLKTGVPARVPWVRIPPLPPKPIEIVDNCSFYDLCAQSSAQSVFDDTDTIGLIVLLVVVAALFIASKWQARKAKADGVPSENHVRRDARIRGS